MQGKSILFSRAVNILYLYTILNCLLVWSGNIPYSLTISIIVEFFVILLLIFLIIKKIRAAKLLGKKVFIIYLLWCFFIILKSLYNLNDKQNIAFFIHNTLSILLISSVFIFSDILYIKIFYKRFIKIGIPIFLILSFYMLPGCWGWYLTPIHLIIIFLPQINLKWKIIYLILFAMSISDIGTRANLLRGIATIGCLFLTKINSHSIINPICKFISIILLIGPIILLYLGITGIYNIFESGQNQKDQFYADTRTLVYEEVITSAINNNYIWIGNTFSHGYDSKFQEQFSKSSKKAERTSEVSACNIFTWSGCIGLSLYFLCFITAIYFSVFKSHNSYIKILGVYLAFRWFMVFIEEINSIDPLNITIFMAMSLCLNPYLINQGDKTFIILIKRFTRKT